MSVDLANMTRARPPKSRHTLHESARKLLNIMTAPVRAALLDPVPPRAEGVAWRMPVVSREGMPWLIYACECAVMRRAFLLLQ